MESAQISGKVFRFLSTMHPSLSKPERKRYAEFDPDKWYPWTSDIAGEFTDLMRRSPRDTSFARGLAYAATKGLPEDSRLSPTDVIAGLATLPAAFTGPLGSGFEVQMEHPGFAHVYYRGMPGFSNVCIAIAGELTQRLQAVGARGLDIKHAEGCRLQGGDACRFEVRWSADPSDQVAAPAASSASATSNLGRESMRGTSGETTRESTHETRQETRPETRPETRHETRPETRMERPVERVGGRFAERTYDREPERVAAAGSSTRFEEPPPRPVAAAPRPSPAPSRPAPPPPPRPASTMPPPPPTGAAAGSGSAEDLFEQLRSRLVDAERQSSRHAELEAHIAALDARAAQLEAALADAEADAQSARDALADLKRRLRDLVG